MVISLIFLLIIFYWINYLTKNKFIVNCLEGFTETESSKTSHTVNLPLTTTYSCQNFCGPTARCSITGQQCSADIDCPGCQPYVPPLSKDKTNCIPGDNDAGKLTYNINPRYSELTTDIGTQAKLFTSDKFSKPAMANFGINTWRASFDIDRKLFDKRYEPSNLKYMPNYPKRYSSTGEFIEDGPLASNAYFS